MGDLLHDPFIKGLLTLGMSGEDYVIAGSGPLFARGLISTISDLDVVAKGKAWECATRLARPGPAPFGEVSQVSLFDGTLEILDGWFPELWTVDELIQSADEFDGIRFVNLAVVRRSKKILSRPNDLLHIAIIDKYIASGGV